MATHEVTPVLATDDAHYDVEVFRDVRIPTAEPGISLSADVVRPVGVGPVPALLCLLPYRKDAGAGIMNERSLHRFARRGYASVLVDFLGTGSSDGRQRPPFDPAEADDGVAAVEWAVRQPWCDGNVGIWGHSYGAVMALRTASRRPSGLRAIIPVMGMTDPGPDFVHPGGRRGCLASLAQWSTDTLLNQLLPPLYDFESPEQQRRWRDRMHSDPWLLDLFGHGPDDPVWPTRAIDLERIEVPTFCVAGWRDLFCEGTISAYGRIRAPKRLLAGPWMHTMPEDSPFLPVDFPALALRWWRHWLLGVDDGLLDEPPVTVYEQGRGGWEQHDSWPPACRDRRFVTAGTTLTESDRPVPTGSVVAERAPDPTVGTLSGLSGMPTAGFGLPLDQHDDDARCLVVTSEPLDHELCIAGRASVTVWADGFGPVSPVVRLTDVDEHDRSVLISSGVATGQWDGQCDGHRAELTSTRYTVPAGHRVRVVVDSGDFPRLWPAPGAGPVLLRGVEVRLPVVAAEPVPATLLPRPADRPVDGSVSQEPMWRITRDLVHDGVTVTIGERLTARTPGERHLLHLSRELAATVSREPVVEAVVRGTTAARVELTTNTVIDVAVTLHLTEREIVVHGRIEVHGAPVFTRRWSATA